MNILEQLKSTKEDKNFTFSTTNYILILVGVIILFIGFVLLAGGASTDPDVFYTAGEGEADIFNFRRLTLAPIVILFGFFFEIFAILWKTKSKSNE